MSKNKHTEFGAKLIKRAQSVKDHYDGKQSDVQVQRFPRISFVDRASFSGAEVKRIRVEAKLTQEALAELLATSVDTVRKWEQNASQPMGPASRLLQLIEAEGIPKVLIAHG